MDTLVLSQKRIKYEFPRIDFYPDSNFCYYYNVKLDTVSIMNKHTGEIIEKIIDLPRAYLLNKDKRMQIANNFSNKVENQYSSHTIMQNVLTVYNSLLD